MDFFDILLAKKLEDDRDPKVEGLSVTANGTYSEDGVVYKPVVVNVPETPLSSLSVTANGTYTAPSGTAYNEVDVNVPLPENAYLLEEYEDVPTDIASFTASDAPLKSLTVSIIPVQDLHGYDSPWAGGAGKNKLPLTVETVKSLNASGTWSGNAYTINNVTFTLLLDNGGNVIGININGTASAEINPFNLGNITFEQGSSYKVTGGSDASINGVGLGCNGFGIWETNEDRTIDRTTSTTFDSFTYIKVASGAIISNKVIKPMIRLASETDPTFAPYSNICPISGWTEEVITVADDTTTPTVEQTYTIPFTDSQWQSVEVFGGSVDVVNGVVTPCPYYASYNGEQLIGEWISDRDVYAEGTTPTIGAQVVNIGATGTPFSVQPTSIKSLDGENNVSASTGQIEDLEFFTKETS
jgi:hypothetical protein